MVSKPSGKTPLTDQEQRALRYVRNMLVHLGRTPSTRELAGEVGRSSSRSGALILQRLIDKRYLERRKDGKIRVLEEPAKIRGSEETVLIPLVGMAPCGRPLVSEENLEAMIPVSTKLVSRGAVHFLLRASGNSMNQAGIDDGDLVLVRQQPTADNGDRVVALIDDEATIKEFRRSGNMITLVPRSSDKSHQPIILTSSFRIQGIVRGTVKNWEKG